MRVELMLDGFDGGILVMQQHMIPAERPAMVGIMLDNDFRVPVSQGTTDEGIWDLVHCGT